MRQNVNRAEIGIWKTSLICPFQEKKKYNLRVSYKWNYGYHEPFTCAGVSFNSPQIWTFLPSLGSLFRTCFPQNLTPPPQVYSCPMHSMLLAWLRGDTLHHEGRWPSACEFAELTITPRLHLRPDQKAFIRGDTVLRWERVNPSLIWEISGRCQGVRGCWGFNQLVIQAVSESEQVRLSSNMRLLTGAKFQLLQHRRPWCMIMTCKDKLR